MPLFLRQHHAPAEFTAHRTVKRCGQRWQPWKPGTSRAPPLRQGHLHRLCIQTHLGGGHGTTSQHYAGVSFDGGQNVSAPSACISATPLWATKAWGYVEPISMTPRWVHFDRRYGTAACSGVGYPICAAIPRNDMYSSCRMG